VPNEIAVTLSGPIRFFGCPWLIVSHLGDPVDQRLTFARRAGAYRVTDEFDVVITGDEHGPTIGEWSLQMRAAPHHRAFVMRRSFVWMELLAHA
jgi:hypothetical protein